MAVRGVNDDGVRARLDERLSTFKACIADSGSCGDAETSAFVFCRIRVYRSLVHVFDSQQADTFTCGVNDDEALNTVLLKQLACIFNRHIHCDGDNIFRHQAANRLVEVTDKACVTIGNNADELIILNDGNP